MTAFNRIAGVLDVPRLLGTLVVIIGVGRMGSRIAWHLARSGVGRFVFIDPQLYEDHNFPGHVLDPRYVGWPKAEAAARSFVAEMRWLHATGLMMTISRHTSATRLSQIFADASLVVMTTDDLDTQYRGGEVAAALEIPTVFPGLFDRHGGEVFLGLGPRFPCFRCYSGFRPLDAPLHGVAATSHDSLAVEQAAVHIALGVLDPRSRYAEIITGSRARTAPMQVFPVASFGAPQGAIFRDQRPWARAAAQWRPRCPGCAAIRRAQTSLRTHPQPPATTHPQTTPPPRSRRRRILPGGLGLGVLGLLLALALVGGALPGSLHILARPKDTASQTAVTDAQTATASADPRIAVVTLTRRRITPSLLAPELHTAEVGSVLTHAAGAQPPSLIATAGAVGRPESRGHGWWQWRYQAPTTPGTVTLTLKATFPGASYDVDVDPLTFSVVRGRT